MDLSPTTNDLDSTTESYTSSVAEEESLHSDDSTIYEVDSSSPRCKNFLQHILDKEVSVDESLLGTPLEPIYFTEHNGVNNKISEEQILPSILRRKCSSTGSLRKVSFPMVETELVTYREPDCNGTWNISSFLSAETIQQIYQASCKEHKTIELDSINTQILEIKDNTNHSAVLNLNMINITFEVNETLEDLLKVANFRTINLSDCKFTPETISELLNMLEYYESVCEIEIAMDFDEIEAWKCFCNACMNMMLLESISFKGISINESYMRMLLNAVEKNNTITVLRFDSCTLVKLPSFYLVESLMTNVTLSELYLPSTGLYTKEADCLGRFLQRNFTLKVLDISNNCIGDRGLEVLAKGLTKQKDSNGLSVLLVFNNQLTKNSGPIINNIIKKCRHLHTLNVGYNSLTDEVISNVTQGLEVTTSLEGLGLQCTLLTCKGIDYLATAIENNTSLQKINLKGNKAIQVPGLERLCQALTSSKIYRIEIDETNRSANNPEAYVQLVKKINGICTVNRTLRETSYEEIANAARLISRKVSLSCEPRYLIPDISASHQVESLVSPPKSAKPKNRFSITKVQDANPRPISRFKVSPVIPSLEEDPIPEKFANVRSSVSSTDSVDSLQLDMDSDE